VRILSGLPPIRISISSCFF